MMWVPPGEYLVRRSIRFRSDLVWDDIVRTALAPDDKPLRRAPSLIDRSRRDVLEDDLSTGTAR